MGLVFKTKLFSINQDLIENTIMNKTQDMGMMTGGLLGAGVGYIGGRIVGKVLTPSEYLYIKRYIKKHPGSHTYQAQRSYNRRRGIFKALGVLAGGAIGASKGFKVGNNTGEAIINTKNILV